MDRGLQPSERNSCSCYPLIFDIQQFTQDLSDINSKMEEKTVTFSSLPLGKSAARVVDLHIADHASSPS